MNPIPQDPDGDNPCRVPLRLWWVPVSMAVLRALPFLMTRVLTPPPGITLPAVGHNPIDSFAYVAFIRQAAETGVWMFDNPYATQVQDGRFLLPLFAVLGHLCRWTGLDPFWALELARVPLLFLFVAVLWRFLAPFIPEMNRRLTAVWMVGFAGGIEVLARPLVGLLPAALQNLAHQALSDEQGWNTFAAAYNPLWLAGLTLTMIALRPWLEPPERQKARDWFQAGLGLAAAYWVHPYSGLVVLAVIAMLPLLRWSLGLPVGSPGYRRSAGLCLGAALAALAAVTFWQNQDPVYRASAARALGDNPLSLFWYPVTLGGVGWLALRGWRSWVQHAAASRVEVAAWTLAVIACHNSPLINGHHFVFHLHLPLCIVGAPVLHDLLAAATRGPRWKQGAVAVLLAALLQSPLAVTWRSIGAALNYQVPTPVMNAIDRLAHEPAGRVYTTPHIGTLVPAYSAHRTYVGHWFLTPDYSARQAQFNGLVAGHVAPAEFIALLERERIRCVLLPPATPPAIAEALEPLAREVVRFDQYTLALLR